MQYAYEFLFTFFMAFFCSDLGQTSIEQGLTILFAFTFIHAVSKKSYANAAINLSFVVTAYRSIGEVLVCFLALLAGSAFALLMLLATGYSRPAFETDLALWQILVVEFIAAFFIALVYYALFVDLRQAGEHSSAVAVACMYGAFAIAFPQLPAGNFIKLVVGMSADMKVVGGSLIGQLFGAILGGLFYKTLICKNNDVQKRELDISSHKVNINF